MPRVFTATVNSQGKSVKARQDVFLVRTAIQEGCTVSVFVDGECEVKRSTSFREVFKMLDDVDEATVVVRDANGECVGKAFLVYEYGQMVDEIVCDHSCDDKVDDIMTRYSAKYHS